MFVSANTVIFEGSKHPGRPRHPWNWLSDAGRASSRTTVPAGKKALHVPAPLPPVITQLMPAGWDVMEPLPPPPGTMLMLPVPPVVGVGVGAVLGVQPASDAWTEVAPSLTVTRHVGELKLVASMRNRPVLSAVPRATPSTVIVAFGTAPW